MPQKTCPNCDAQHGVRKLKCDCGYEFIKKKPATKKDQYIGIGSWIQDIDKGMPKIDMPEPLPDQPTKLTTRELSYYIAYEGICYCIFAYIDSTRIKDKKLAKMWQKAKEQLTEIVGYVEEHERDEEDPSE
jgi:hypothetical protein